MACYNHEKYVTDTLKSIVAQTNTDWECIIVNDGSTDNSSVVIKEFILDREKFTFIEQENKGVSVARNLAAKHARGKYLLPIDSDDLISPNFIQSLLDSFLKNPELTLVQPEVFLFGKKNKRWTLPPYSFKGLLAENMIVVSSLFRRSDFENVGGFDECMHKGSEDWEFFIRLLNAEKKVVKAEEAVIFYRIKTHSKNAEVLANRKTRFDTFEYIGRKNAIIYNQFFDSPLVLHHKLIECKKPLWKKMAKVCCNFLGLRF